ncbi:MAG: hypothetical protein P9L99_14170 [Candidatus Lernaella stagnicola]|nr:hypothetical protein [Candidatus Lernaella stagnicola]
MATLRELERRLARLEQAYQHAISAVSDPVTGGAVETYFVGLDGVPSPEPAIVAPFPGCAVVVPPGCSVIIANATDDPLVVAGNPSPVAAKAMIAWRIEAQAAGGGIVIVDPVAGTGGMVITPTGVDIKGGLSVEGVPLP